MSNDLVKRLRVLATPYGLVKVNDIVDAADRIEELEMQLSLINNTLSVTLSEKMTTDWKDFCEALIAETRELLGEESSDK